MGADADDDEEFLLDRAMPVRRIVRLLEGVGIRVAQLRRQHVLHAAKVNAVQERARKRFVTVAAAHVSLVKPQQRGRSGVVAANNVRYVKTHFCLLLPFLFFLFLRFSQIHI